MSITGKVEGIGGHVAEYRVSASVSIGASFTGGVEGKFSSDGSFEIVDLPPGLHHVALTKQGTGGLTTVGIAEVELLDRNVSGIVITPFEPAEIQVRVTVEGEEKPLTIGSVFVDSVGEDGSLQRGFYAFTPEDGVYHLNHLAPGKYWIGFTNAVHCYLKSVKSGGSEINPQAFEIQSGAHLDVTLTYSRGVASLSGDVIVPQDQSHKPLDVLLLRQDDPSRAQAWNVELDQRLHFSIDNRAPGKYLAIALEDDDPGVWENPDFMRLLRSEASSIELHETSTRRFAST